MNKRNEAYDTIAGIMILCAIFLHTGVFMFKEYTPLHFFGFFMLWFFYKSGMFYRKSGINVKWFWNKIIRRLIIPFLVTGYFGYIFYCICNSLNVTESLHGMLSPIGTVMKGNAPCWFLITFVGVKLMSEILLRNLNIQALGGAILLLLCLTISLHYWDKIHVVTILNSTMALIYCLLGYLLRDVQYKRLVFYIALLLYFAIGLFYPSEINIATTQLCYGNYEFSIVYNVAGIIVINNLFTKHQQLNLLPLRHIGKNSMTYFLFHYPVIILVGWFCDNNQITEIWRTVCVLCALLIVLPVFDWLMQKKEMKWIVGN